MKGIVFKQFERFVTESFGAHAFEEILDRAELTTGPPFLGPGLHSDEDLMALVGAAVEALGVPANVAVHAFGRFLFSRLAGTVPGLVRPEGGLFGLLEEIDSVIHVEVSKLWPDARTPRFEHARTASGGILLHYESERMLCDLVLGLIEGAAAHFDESVAITHAACKARGDARCTFEVTKEVTVHAA